MWIWIKRCCTWVGFILAIIGLGGIPDDIKAWRTAMKGLSSYLLGTCDFAGGCGRWVFVVTGITFMGLGTSKQLKREILSLWNRRNEPPWELPREYISMKEAAGKIYEAAKAGKIPLGEASEKLSGWSGTGPTPGSPEDILHWWAGHISKQLTVYGSKPPSSLLKAIPPREVKQFIFADGATKLKDPIHDSVYYTNVAVKLDALDEQYNFAAGFHGESQA